MHLEAEITIEQHVPTFSTKSGNAKALKRLKQRLEQGAGTAAA
jgi:hypothetical protein